MSCGQWLILAGGAVEFVGVSLVAREIVKDVKAAADIAPKGQTITLTPAREFSRAGVLRLSTGGDRTLEQRVAELEEALPQMQETLEDRLFEVRKSVLIEHDQDITAVRKGVQDLSDRLGKFLAEVFGGDVGWRVAGLMLILGGIVLNVTGSIVTS